MRTKTRNLHKQRARIFIDATRQFKGEKKIGNMALTINLRGLSQKGAEGLWCQ